MKKKRRSYLLQALLVIILVFIDQITKFWAKTALPGNPISLIPGVLKLQYHENTGALFGIMSDNSLLLGFVSLLSLLLVIALYKKTPLDKKYNILRFIWILLLSGGIGNIIDRFTHRYVIDFIYFELIDFPIFNVADSYVTISVALIIISLIYHRKDGYYDFLEDKADEGKDNSNHEEKS